jgi:phage baseplate assembly protein gpV
MKKNILADTDFASGHDNRFKSSVVVGFVSKIECNSKRSDVRVIFPDRVDHENTPLITKPIPVLQTASQSKRSFAVPRIGDFVAVMKMPNATGDYFVLGTFYSPENPPPVTDPKLDYTEWEGGHTQKFDANDDADVFLTQDFKGGINQTVKKDVNIKTTDGAKYNIEADGDMLLKSATGNINVESPSGIVTINQQEIDLTATTIKLNGHVIVTGNIDQTGVHHDNNGYHTSGRSVEELEKRVARLERIVAQLTEAQA